MAVKKIKGVLLENNEGECCYVPRRDPYKRAAIIVVALILAGMFSLLAANQNWYGAVFAGSNGQTVSVALSPAELATEKVVMGPGGPKSATYSLLGFPAQSSMLFVGLLLSGVGFLVRQGLLSLMGLGAVWVARSSAVSMEALLLNQVNGGRFWLLGTAYESFVLGVWVVLALQLILAIQLVYCQHVERRIDMVCGHDPEQNVLDSLQGSYTSIIDRFNPEKKQKH